MLKKVTIGDTDSVRTTDGSEMLQQLNSRNKGKQPENSTTNCITQELEYKKD